VSGFGTQFNPLQRAQALALLEATAWESMGDALGDTERLFRRLLDATVDDLRRWEADLGPALVEEGYNELTLPNAVVRRLPLWDKLSYVARLLEALALSYGSPYDAWARRYPGPAGEPPSTPADLLYGLNDLRWMPTADQEPSKGRV
jgi:hypothetical protein